MSQAASSPPLGSRLQLPATLCFRSLSLPLQALVDSGAEDSFIDEEVAKQCGLSLQPLPTPIMARALNGSFLAELTHYTVPVTVVLSGSHSEQIRFCVMPAPHMPLVLGFHWLKLHNPQINWASNKISAWSTFCLSHCLQSALSPSTDTSAPVPAKPPDLSMVPEEYHDLGPVFSEELAVSLPTHARMTVPLISSPGLHYPPAAFTTCHVQKGKLWRPT